MPYPTIFVDGQVLTAQSLNDLVAETKRIDAKVLTGPGRADQPATTSGTITGTEPSGTIYVSNNQPSGASVWQKQGTSWVVLVGDTGWRDLTATARTWASGADFNNGIARFLIRRVGPIVYVNWFGVTVNNTTKNDKFGAIPTGFQGMGNDDNKLFPIVSDTIPYGQGGQFGMREGTSFQLWGNTTGGNRSCLGYWPTAQPWPTTLPGTAA